MSRLKVTALKHRATWSMQLLELLRHNSTIRRAVAYGGGVILFNLVFANIVLMMGLPVFGIVFVALFSIIGVPLLIFTFFKLQGTPPSMKETDADQEEVWLLERPLVGIATRPSIAILPLWTAPGDARMETYAKGLAEEVAARMIAETNFIVIGRNSSGTYKEQHPSILQIRDELGVKYVLTGELDCNQGRLCADFNLWDTSQNSEVWQDNAEVVEADVFDLVARIFAHAGSTLSGSLQAWDAERMRRHVPAKADAWLAYAEASALYRTDQPGDHARCAELCRQSISLDSEFARPHSLLSRAIAVNLALGALPDPEASAAEAEAEAETSLGLGLADAEVVANASQALLRLRRHRRALEVARITDIRTPGSASLAASIGICQIALGNTAAGISDVRRALRLSPVDCEMSYWLQTVAVAFTVDGDYEQAIKHARAAIHRQPNSFLSWLILANALALSGSEEDARAATTRARTIFPKLAPDAIDDQWQSFFAKAETAGLLTRGLKQVQYGSIPAHGR